MAALHELNKLIPPTLAYDPSAYKDLPIYPNIRVIWYPTNVEYMIESEDIDAETWDTLILKIATAVGVESAEDRSWIGIWDATHGRRVICIPNGTDTVGVRGSKTPASEAIAEVKLMANVMPHKANA